MITFPFSYSCSFSEFIFGFVFYLNRFLESNTLHKVPLLLFGASLVAQMVKKVKVLVTQSCPTLCDPMDWRPPGSSVHGILQARILEWVAIPFSRGSSWPRNQIQVSHILYCLSHLGSPLVVAICPEKNWRKKEDFPGGRVVKTPAFQCRGHGFDP